MGPEEQTACRPCTGFTSVDLSTWVGIGTLFSMGDSSSDRAGLGPADLHLILGWWGWQHSSPSKKLANCSDKGDSMSLSSWTGNGTSLSSRYFSRPFFARFLNLITHTLVHFLRFTHAIQVFYLAFMLSTCISTYDSHEFLWQHDYTLHFILILHSHSFLQWNEDLIDFFETSDG